MVTVRCANLCIGAKYTCVCVRAHAQQRSSTYHSAQFICSASLYTYMHTRTQEDLRNASPSPVMESPTTLPLPQALPSNLTNMSVCSACKMQYQQLVQYYFQYKKEVESQGCSVCADIEDHVSMTFMVVCMAHDSTAGLI